MKKIIEQGQLMPKGYGYSYTLFDRLAYVCHPFPFNHFFGFFRAFWLKIRHSAVDREHHKRMSELEMKIGDLKQLQYELKKDRESFELYKIALMKAIESMILPRKEN